MIAKQKERERAIKLRRKGLSYREILVQVPVAKSSLSLWLKSVKLLPGHAYRITEKRLAAARGGALKKKNQRITLTKEIKDKARAEIGQLSKRELFLIGVALYWAEGSKEKEHRPGGRIIFSNSDSEMVKFFLKWLLEVIELPKDKVYLNIVLHETSSHRIKEVKKYWLGKTGLSAEHFGKIYFKKNKINTKRKNVGENYFGLIRLSVKESSVLNRRIQGWTEGIHQST